MHLDLFLRCAKWQKINYVRKYPTSKPNYPFGNNQVLHLQSRIELTATFHDDKTPSMQLYWKTHTAYVLVPPTVNLSQGVTLVTRSVGGKAIQDYWRNTNRTGYTQPELSSIDGKYTKVGHTIVTLQFIPFGYGG